MARGRYAVKGRTRIIALSAVYQRGKTQVPSEVRRFLGLEDGHKIVWILSEGEIVVRNSEDAV